MIVVDTESSGLDYARCALLSIGALDFADPKNRFYGECRAFAGAQIEERALQVNGFTREQLADPAKQDLAALLQAFAAWMAPIADKTLAGLNTWYDQMVLLHSARRCGLAWDLGHRVVDLHSIAYAALLARGEVPPRTENGVTALNTDAIHRYTGLGPEPKPHNALTGALIEAESLSRLIYGRPLLPEFAEASLPPYLTR